jgi:hypothetical protein
MKKPIIRSTLFSFLIVAFFFSPAVCISQETFWQWQNPVPPGNDLAGPV